MFKSGKILRFSKNDNYKQPVFLTSKLGLSCATFGLIVARFQFPGEPCLHGYIYLLEDYSGVCICSEFKHTFFFSRLMKNKQLFKAEWLS